MPVCFPVLFFVCFFLSLTPCDISLPELPVHSLAVLSLLLSSLEFIRLSPHLPWPNACHLHSCASGPDICHLGSQWSSTFHQYLTSFWAWSDPHCLLRQEVVLITFILFLCSFHTRTQCFPPFSLH